jgi:hypothetical protein
MTGNASDATEMGIVPRVVLSLFQNIDNAKDKISYKVVVTYIEIYNELIRDLLDDSSKKTNLQIREDTSGEFFVGDVTELIVSSCAELLGIMTRGSKNRATSMTNMNDKSSRSHAVFTVSLTQQNSTKDVTLHSKLVLVDLAGSEAVKKSGAEGGQLKEAASINQSLSSLGLVINALTTKGTKHIPFRNSSLTKLLRASLG